MLYQLVPLDAVEFFAPLAYGCCQLLWEFRCVLYAHSSSGSGVCLPCACCLRLPSCPKLKLADGCPQLLRDCRCVRIRSGRRGPSLIRTNQIVPPLLRRRVQPFRAYLKANL